MAWLLSIILAVLVAAVVIYSRSHTEALILLFLLPWLAIVMRLALGRVFCINIDSRHPRISLTVPSLLTCGGVGMAIPDVELIGFGAIILLTLLLSVLLVLLIARVFPEARQNFEYIAALATIGLVGAVIYAAALLLLFDTRFDRVPEKDVLVLLADKQRRTGRSPMHTFYLKPWGSDLQQREVQVGSSLYGSVRVGERVCIHRYAGSLGIPWFTVGQRAECRHS